VSPAERATFGMTLSFATTILSARGITYALQRRSRSPGLRSLARRAVHAPDTGPRVHHFVPGVGLVLAAGATAIGTRDDGREFLLSVPFGVGAGLILDEFGLLLNLDNPYWGKERIALAQAQVAFVIAGILAARILRAGRREPRRGDDTAHINDRLSH
jgi:hypothetical protein